MPSRASSNSIPGAVVLGAVALGAVVLGPVLFGVVVFGAIVLAMVVLCAVAATKPSISQLKNDCPPKEYLLFNPLKILKN